MDGLEIERKFLVSELPDNLEKYNHDEIEQGYIILEKNIEERIRHRGNKFYHTKKVGHGKVREEYENEITEEIFDSLWPRTEGKRIFKTRYLIPYDIYTIELDVYHDKLDGLVVAEIEFDTLEQSNLFIKPKWFGEEITNDNKYKNRNLIFTDFEKIK